MKNNLLAALFAICLVGYAEATPAFVKPTVSARPSHDASSQLLEKEILGRFALRLRPSIRCTVTGGPLFAKKKKNAAGGKGGKVQVKLLKHVPGTGKVGDVIMVAPAFFENKLKRSQSAVLITDDEVAMEREEQAKEAKETLEAATEMKNKIEGLTLTFPMKAGPKGHLFGGVNYKAILTELTKQFPKGALSKGVKIETVKDGEGNAIPHDIKEIGDFNATVSLLKDVSADCIVSVIEQK